MNGSITLACPKCGGTLSSTQEGMRCVSCDVLFPVRSGIPDFLMRGVAASPKLKESLRVFDKSGAQAVLNERHRSNIGLLGFKSGLLLDIAILGAAIVFAVTGQKQALWALLGLLAFSFVDYVAFKIRRGRILRGYAETPLSIMTPDEWDVANELAEDCPGMQDNIGEAGQTEVDSFTQRKWDYRYETCASYADRDGCVVVDAGSGEGYLQRFIRPSCLYVAVDVIDNYLKQVKESAPDSVPIKASAYSIPLPDNSVDYVICSESLEHYPNPLTALTEFARIIKHAGRVILTFPNAHRMRNPNLFHVLIDLVGGDADKRILQPVTMHQNMWFNATTHHYDFTTRMVKDMAQWAGLKIDHLSSFYFPIPYQGPLKRISLFRFLEAALSKIPLVRFFGSSLLVVLSPKDRASLP